MKLLIVTQIVNEKHPVLGFFHAWIIEFAKQCETVTVICLEEGEHSLPDNVKVLSLGKEKDLSKLQILANFYKYIWQQRKNYTSVFVHMNQIYVILGGVLWKLLGKKIGLWYTHGTVSKTLCLATLLTDKVFTASEESFKIDTSKKYVTGHGIDTCVFKPQQMEKTLDFITVGRIAESKNLEAMIEAVGIVKKNTDIRLQIVGSPVTSDDSEYKKKLEVLISSLGLQDVVNFHGPIQHKNLPELLGRSKVFVTTAINGSLDKVILEAMACGLPVISMAEGSKSLPLKDGQVKTSEELVIAIMRVLGSSNYHYSEYVTYVESTHGLKQLIQNINNLYVQQP